VWASALVVPVAIVARRNLHQGARHSPDFHPLEASLGPAGTVPAIVTATPIPAIAKEDFFVKTLHHLDTRLHHHQPGGSREAKFDMDVHLRLGEGGAERQQKSQEERLRIHDGVLGEKEIAPKAVCPPRLERISRNK